MSISTIPLNYAEKPSEAFLENPSAATTLKRTLSIKRKMNTYKKPVEETTGADPKWTDEKIDIEIETPKLTPDTSVSVLGPKPMPLRKRAVEYRSPADYFDFWFCVSIFTI
jgi:hypothetical protein